jgi:hypothetical protein
MNKVIATLILTCLALRLQAGNIRLDRLTTEMQEGFAVVERPPRLSWTMQSAENNTSQSAYEIEISELHTGRSVWRSGKVRSAKSHLVSTQDARLSRRNSPHTYAWRVRVWDERDTPSDWSQPAAFHLVPEWTEETRKTESAQRTKDIQKTEDAQRTEDAQPTEDAQWIGAITRKDARIPEGRSFHGTDLKKPEVRALWEAVDTLSRKSICLRKAFRVTKQIAEATVYICGLGNYELSLNGAKVGDGEFTPLWSDFDRTVYYNVYDVTDCLRKGRNVAGVLLGNGFYNVQGGRYVKLKVSFGPPTLLFRLQINYTDGTRETIVSGADWKYALSPITFNCVYGGESYDARLEQKGWDKPGFDDAAWLPAVIQEAPKGALRPQQAPPVRIMERYGVRNANPATFANPATLAPGMGQNDNPVTFVLDMGQNLAGFPEITLRGKRGQKVTLRVSEALTEEGAADQRQTGRPHYYEYTLRGDGDETWRPRFSYYGFRYIQVEGAVWHGLSALKDEPAPKDELPVLKQISSCFVHNSARQVSTFETSNALFNATHRLIGKAVRSNMQAVFTDCPHREKLGWLEQVHLNGPGLLYNYDLRSYGPKLIQDMADAQRPDGAIPSIAPQYVVFAGAGMDAFAESPEWGSAFIIFPFMYYRAYGDDTLIRTHYRRMRAYVDYLTSRADRHIVSFGLGDWYDYGDFKAGFSRNTPVALVATAHYYMDLTLLAEAARMVGNACDANHYADLAGQVKKAFNNRFLDRETAQYGTGSQCSNALPLFLGLPESDRQYARTLHNLTEDIHAHGNRLTTGDVGNRYLIQSLARNGRHGLLYSMFNHEDTPGYGFQLKFGATTLTEQWDPRQGSSWNHFMMGQIDEWFFHSLAGIQVDASAEGPQAIVIRPQVVADLDHVRASTETPYGTVKVDWKREGANVTLEVVIPANASATIYPPGDEGAEVVMSGTHRFISYLPPSLSVDSRQAYR